jgi:hypothetical protein
MKTDKPFVLKNGTKLETMHDLYGALSTMSDTTYNEHVTTDKNDFANWVEHVIGDKFLANAMRRATTKQELQRAVFMGIFK